MSGNYVIFIFKPQILYNHFICKAVHLVKNQGGFVNYKLNINYF